MGDVTGPISTLPGRRHELPEGAMCDDHPDRPAVARVQGETDSFGCEMLDLCQECMDDLRAYERSEEAHTGRCDWCKKDVTDLADARDYDEGMHGPVYRVCAACRKRRDDEARAELDAMDDGYEPWDDDDCDCVNASIDVLAGTAHCHSCGRSWIPTADEIKAELRFQAECAEAVADEHDENAG